VSRVIRRKIAEGAEVVTTYGVPDNEQERIVADLRRDFEQSDYDTTILEGYAADRAVQPEAPTDEQIRAFLDKLLHTDPEILIWIRSLLAEREARTASQERPQPDPSSALFTIPRWQYTDEDEGITADVVWLNDAVQAVEGVAQERPQPELPIWTEEQVAEGWIDPSPEACTCQRKDALGSYVPCSLHDVGVAQERPPIDVADLTRLLGETGWYIEDDEGNELAYDVAADWIARLAGGPVASPEPDAETSE
jgi:hypothetical protein